MAKIPQAVAMILLASALACPICSEAQTSSQSGTRPNTIMKTRGATEVEALLREFLANVNDPKMHDRFWSDELIYVGASGKVRTKAEIMKNVSEEAAKPKTDADKKDDGRYDAEDVKVRQYGDVCVLNFRLVAVDAKGDKTYFRNAGVLTQHDGKWQVISWQATRETEQPNGK